ncbi:putative 7-dehydrocholesterol reductase [Helianthus anomalus]
MVLEAQMSHISIHVYDDDNDDDDDVRWGLSRHFHYVPEIMAAFFWTVPALFDNFLPYFYVVFLTILLFDRAKRDDGR